MYRQIWRTHVNTHSHLSYSLFVIVYSRRIPISVNPALRKNHTYVCWRRIGKQVMCGSMYSYILSIHHYAPNTFFALPNLWNRWILANTLSILVTTCQFMGECPRMLTNIRYSPILAYFPRIGVCAVPPLRSNWKPFLSAERHNVWTFWCFNIGLCNKVGVSFIDSGRTTAATGCITHRTHSLKFFI